VLVAASGKGSQPNGCSSSSVSLPQWSDFLSSCLCCSRSSRWVSMLA
jgi:hypothetical protein